MKKLLLGFLLIGVFGISITTASITFPEKSNTLKDQKIDENLETSKDISNFNKDINISSNKINSRSSSAKS
jgi:hypothetical protein